MKPTPRSSTLYSCVGYCAQCAASKHRIATRALLRIVSPHYLSDVDSRCAVPPLTTLPAPPGVELSDGPAGNGLVVGFSDSLKSWSIYGKGFRRWRGARSKEQTRSRSVLKTVSDAGGRSATSAHALEVTPKWGFVDWSQGGHTGVRVTTTRPSSRMKFDPRKQQESHFEGVFEGISPLNPRPRSILQITIVT